MVREINRQDIHDEEDYSQYWKRRNRPLASWAAFFHMSKAPILVDWPGEGFFYLIDKIAESVILLSALCYASGFARRNQLPGF
jgi:hypothetical protein